MFNTQQRAAAKTKRDANAGSPAPAMSRKKQKSAATNPPPSPGGGSVASNISSVAGSVWSAAKETLQFFDHRGKQIFEILPAVYGSKSADDISRGAFDKPVSGPWFNLLIQPQTILYKILGACDAQITTGLLEIKRLVEIESTTHAKMMEHSDLARSLNEEYSELGERVSVAYTTAHALKLELHSIEDERAKVESKIKMSKIVIEVIQVVTGDKAMGGEPKPLANISLPKVRERLDLETFPDVMAIPSKSKVLGVATTAKRLGLEDNPFFKALFVNASQDFYDRNGKKPAIKVGRHMVDLETRIHLAECLGIVVPREHIERSWAIKRGEEPDTLPPVMEVDLVKCSKASLVAALAAIEAQEKSDAGANESASGSTD